MSTRNPFALDSPGACAGGKEGHPAHRTVPPMDEWLTSLLWQLGGGAIAGVAVGYATQKATRLGLLLVGILIILLYALMKLGFITVRWDAVGEGIETGARTMGSWLWAMARELSASLVGFSGGFLLGLKLK
ncbi:MAG: FUN14 domain-containing protein [Candidatus Eremiobacterota bacterium]